MTKLKQIISDIVFVSRLTNVNKKKIRIFLSVFLANCTVVFDILVILVFANIIENRGLDGRFYVDYVINNIYLLPLIVVLRFLFIFIERINIQSLQLQVEENLRSHLMKEVFDKNNLTPKLSFVQPVKSKPAGKLCSPTIRSAPCTFSSPLSSV